MQLNKTFKEEAHWYRHIFHETPTATPSSSTTVTTTTQAIEHMQK